MGIDIYARYEGQTPEQVARQLEAWLSGHSGAGYLREAYDGEPYATRYLFAEAFEVSYDTPIVAKVLRERLPETLRLAELRERTICGTTSKEDIEPTLQSYRDFVELCERVEAETGEQVLIRATW